jgi:RNA polymerase sigma-70 factor (ECF subfamily)
MARIAMNAARDLVRRRRVRLTEPLPPDRAHDAPGPGEAAEAVERRARLRAALAQLPERQRLAVVLFEVEGYAHGEIAQLLGIPEGTARSELFHAKRKLRVLLDSLK